MGVNDNVTVDGLDSSLNSHLLKNLPYFNKLLNKDFGSASSIFTASDLCRIKEAYEKAHKIREFEITLFWQRLNYLWAITAVLFAAWGYTLNVILTVADFSKITNMQYISVLVISLFGMVFSVVTRFITEGGKFWQQVWEYHVIKLEPFQSGVLYGMKLGRFNPKREHTYYPSIFRTILIFQKVSHWVWAGSIMYSIYIPIQIKHPEYATESLLFSGVAMIFITLGVKNYTMSKTHSYVDLV